MRRAWRALASMAALILEAFALQRLHANRPALALVLHVAGAGMLSEALDPATDRRRIWIGWFWAALFPVFGVIIGLALPRRGAAGETSEDESWEMQRRHAAAQALAEKQREQTIRPDVLPIVDALRERDGLLRASAIDTLRDTRSKWAVQLLARERENDVYDVRFRAVEGLGRIGGWYLDEIARAKRQLASGDQAREAHVRLAELSFQYANLDIEGGQIAQLYFEEAAAHARRALAMRYDPSIGVLLASACLRMDAVDQAQAEYRRALAADPANAEALLGSAELQLRNRDFAALRDTCGRLHEMGRLSPSELRELSRFWETEQELAWTTQLRRPTSV